MKPFLIPESATKEMHTIGSKLRSCLTILTDHLDRTATKMSEKVLTEEGLLAPATTSSNDLVDTDEMEVNAEETNDEEGNNLSEPDPEPGQRSPRGDAPKKEEKKENRRGTTFYNQNKNHRTTKEINRKRRYSETLSEEKIIEHSAEVLKKP